MQEMESDERIGEANLDTPSSIGGPLEALGEVRSSFQDLIASEVNLLAAEVKQSVNHFKRDTLQITICAALLALSALPFMAFLVIGLGVLLNENYLLSSLIVSVVFALAGGILSWRAYRNIAHHDFKLPATRQNFEREKEAVLHGLQNLKAAGSGRRTA